MRGGDAHGSSHQLNEKREETWMILLPLSMPAEKQLLSIALNDGNFIIVHDASMTSSAHK
jgi:hypothetical protein